MTTRSLICIERDSNKFETIYCHNDGYLTHNGALLLDYYNTRDKAEQLISLGNISALNKILNPNPNEEHNFYKRQQGVVVSYTRDCGNENEESKIMTFQELTNWKYIEYIYIFDLNNTWQFTTAPFTQLQSVKDGLKIEYKVLGFPRPKDFYGFYTGLDILKNRAKFRK